MSVDMCPCVDPHSRASNKSCGYNLGPINLSSSLHSDLFKTRVLNAKQKLEGATLCTGCVGGVEIKHVNWFRHQRPVFKVFN